MNASSSKDKELDSLTFSSVGRDGSDEMMLRDEDEKERDDRDHRTKSESEVVRDLKNELRFALLFTCFKIYT